MSIPSLGPLCSDEQPLQAASVSERGLQVSRHSAQIALCFVVAVEEMFLLFLKALPADAGCWSLSAWLCGHH